MTTDGLLLTEEEWHEFFGADDDDAGERRPNRSKPIVRLMAGIAIAGMVVSSVAMIFGLLRNRGADREPVDILTSVTEILDDSDYAWLVAGIAIEPIFPGTVGAYVTTAPADGIIHIDARPWLRGNLEETVHHEVGHLLAFSAYGPLERMPGGLEVEVWAECAAVDAGVRDTDGETNEAYRCTRDELEVYQRAVGELDVVCAAWGDRICRSIN